MVISPWVHEAVLVGVLLFAWWKGGRSEQIAASGIVVTVLAYEIFAPRLRPGGANTAYDLTLIRDLLQTLFAMAVALRTHRYWAIVAASVSVVSVAVAASQLVRPVHGWAFWTAEIVLMYLALGAIVVGVCQTWAARRRAGA